MFSESIWNISYERTQGHNILTFFPSKTLLSEISVYNLNADRYLRLKVYNKIHLNPRLHK